MSDVDHHLKRLEDLQIENKRLTERLSELSETVARLREAQTFAETISPAKSES
jgi:hypothetical protein